MKIVRNNIIPFKGFESINLFGILFCRKDAVINDIDINHEEIHTAQMKEMLYVFFYIWYFIEWIIKLIIYWNNKKAYRNISFERETYMNEKNMEYLNNRKHYIWFDLIL